MIQVGAGQGPPPPSPCAEIVLTAPCAPARSDGASEKQPYFSSGCGRQGWRGRLAEWPPRRWAAVPGMAGGRGESALGWWGCLRGLYVAPAPADAPPLGAPLRRRRRPRRAAAAWRRRAALPSGRPVATWRCMTRPRAVCAGRRRAAMRGEWRRRHPGAAAAREPWAAAGIGGCTAWAPHRQPGAAMRQTVLPTRPFNPFTV
jgi:hypothetical protein